MLLMNNGLPEKIEETPGIKGIERVLTFQGKLFMV
jgi:hypothetical protein